MWAVALKVGRAKGLMDEVILSPGLDLFEYIADDLKTRSLASLAQLLVDEMGEELRRRRERARTRSWPITMPFRIPRTVTGEDLIVKTSTSLGPGVIMPCFPPPFSSQGSAQRLVSKQTEGKQ